MDGPGRKQQSLNPKDSLDPELAHCLASTVSLRPCPPPGDYPGHISYSVFTFVLIPFPSEICFFLRTLGLLGIPQC